MAIKHRVSAAPKTQKLISPKIGDTVWINDIILGKIKGKVLKIVKGEMFLDVGGGVRSWYRLDEVVTA